VYVDSGVQVGHPDIPCLPVYDPNTNCKGTSIGTDDPWYDPKGTAGHGTHVLGTIGAIGGNGEGVAGMVPNSDGICYLVARVVDDEGHGIYASSVLEAIDWAVSEEANVINMSLSGDTSFQAGQEAMNSAYASGALLVASVGNSGSETFNYPASFDHVMSVAAVTTAGSRAEFSTYNNKVDVAAPGVDILSTDIDGGYSAMSGTSMAASHVTGAIAKVWTVCSQCSNLQVESCLLTTTSSPFRRSKQLGFGFIHTADAYDCLVHTDGCCAETTEKEEELEPELIERDRGPDEAMCNRSDIGERCTRGIYCCSGNCDGQTCQAA
jgi:serine protease